MSRVWFLVLCLVAGHASQLPENSSLLSKAAPGESSGFLSSLLNWAIRHSDAGELKRLAAAASPSEAERDPSSGTHFSADELAAKRARNAEAMAYFDSLPTPAALVSAAAEVLRAPASTAEQREAALLELADLADSIDTANDFGKLGALSPLVAHLDASTHGAAVRSAAALALGVASSNNPPAAGELAALGAVDALLLAVAGRGGDEAEPQGGAADPGGGAAARIRAMYALSCVVRLPGPGREAFHAAGGTQTLRLLFVSSSAPHASPRLAVKALVLLTDLAGSGGGGGDESGGGGGGGGGEEHAEFVRAVVRTLSSPDTDAAEKAARAVVAMASGAAWAREGAGGALDALQKRVARDAGEPEGHYAREVAAVAEGASRAVEAAAAAQEAAADEAAPAAEEEAAAVDGGSGGDASHGDAAAHDEL